MRGFYMVGRGFGGGGNAAHSTQLEGPDTVGRLQACLGSRARTKLAPLG